MSSARLTTHNPRQGLGSRLVWLKISTVETTPMHNSAMAESGARARPTPFYSITVPLSCKVFRAIVVFPCQ